ncbi:ParB/Srx family N-terminal domain-containing protein [Streptomyces sp. AK02-01A]|uniref:ParB/Srx family N-terminal domain-containing protein n=1 Tax=Streptomyces sp. AK02-01A TaxID=3028648 RepID=UPI0029B78B0E|nr:ParB/Srx family N-terminal domain-containing protein [Streptomyces sp. AK02-01A]MDX3855641.1 ParB/Srx family N-terminal domain-containing protein [Streptomyces sp. AK02-01A]
MTGSARTRPSASGVSAPAGGRPAGVLRALAAGLAAGALALGGVLAGGGPAAAASGPDCGGPDGAALCARTGDLLDVTLDQLRPTQPSIGFDQIYYKLGRYGSTKDEEAGDFNKRFDDWCETNGQEEAATVTAGARLSDPSSFTCTVPLGEETDETRAAMKTVVIGPGGALYLTDGHHTLTSFLEAADGGPKTRIRLRVTGNLSDLSTAAFWDTMRDRDWVWLRDENNKPITTDQLPQRLGLARFHDDRYRSLVYFTRDIGYQAPDDAAEYLEFLWGTWLRERVDLDTYRLDDAASYLSAVRAASEAMSAVAGDTVIADGRTADELGRMDEWNDGKKPTGGEFGKLSAPISDEKPGKLAFALDFRGTVAPTPACTRTLTGEHTGPLVISSGVTCLDRAQVTGPVVVGAGAGLVANGAEITGPVQAVGANTVHLCGTSLTGPLSVVNTVRRLTLTGPGCTANELNGPVQLVGNPVS